MLSAHHSSNLPSFDTLHVLMRSRHDDADCLYLVVTDFACQPCVFQTVLDGCCSVFHSIGIVDEFSVKMRASWIGVLRYDKTLDVGGSFRCRNRAPFHNTTYPYGFPFFLACETMVDYLYGFCRWLGRVQRVQPLWLINFQRCLLCGSENSQ